MSESSEASPNLAFNDPSKLALIQMSLSAAVPLWILEFKSQGGPDFSRVREYENVLVETGEAFLYRIPGKTAAAFNAVAKAIATLAFVPDGITIFGLHFEEKMTEE